MPGYEMADLLNSYFISASSISSNKIRKKLTYIKKATSRDSHDIATDILKSGAKAIISTFNKNFQQIN